MVDISILYAIDLDKLYTRNKMSHGQEPAEAAQVKIRGGKIKKQPKLKNKKPAKFAGFLWRGEKAQARLLPVSFSYLTHSMSSDSTWFASLGMQSTGQT